MIPPSNIIIKLVGKFLIVPDTVFLLPGKLQWIIDYVYVLAIIVSIMLYILLILTNLANTITVYMQIASFIIFVSYNYYHNTRDLKPW